MKKLLIIAMACYGLSARAQVRESRNFLYLYSDSTVHADDIKLRRDFSGILRLSVDSRSVPIGQVKFLNSNDGYFANTRRMGIMRSEDFAERIIEGKMNVFQERPLSYHRTIHDVYFNHDAHVAPTTSRLIRSQMYYNKGYTDIKQLTYRNLNKDLADNAQSMDMLRAYRRSRNTTKMLYLSGVVSLVGGLFVLASDGKNAYSTSNMAIGMGLAVLGSGMFAGGYFKSIADRTKLETAIDIYNR